MKRNKKVKINKFLGRAYQKGIYAASCFIKFREPKIIETLENLNDVILNEKIRNVLVFTTKRVIDTDFYKALIKQIEHSSRCYEQIYEINEPTISYIESKFEQYRYQYIDMVIAIGGGSVLDASKLLAARLANPEQKIEKMRGVLKVKHKTIPILAVPTTAGTGSECTVAAVVTNDKTNDKFAVNDPKLIPEYVMFEPSLMYTLTPYLTAITGLDALTHAVEAYIGSSNTKKTKKSAVEAVRLIFNNLLIAYKEPNNTTARKNMQYASYLAGIAFTRAYVGYVHAISHAIGGITHLRHGELCAICLPIMLEQYKESVTKKLSKLTKKAYLASTFVNDKERLSKIFIEKVKELNKNLEIKENLKELVNDDLGYEMYPSIINHINKEVYPLYPVPKYFTDEELSKILDIIIRGE